MLPTATKLATIGTNVCPVSLIFVAYDCVTAKGTKPISMMDRYCFPYRNATSVAPVPAVSVRYKDMRFSPFVINNVIARIVTNIVAYSLNRNEYM